MGYYDTTDDSFPKWAIGLAALVVVLIIGGVWFLATASWVSVPPDKIALHYTGGPIQGTHFKGIIQPGTGTKFYGLLENIYELPATQRNYLIDRSPERGDTKTADHIDGVSSDNVTFQFEAATYFQLNRQPNVLRHFFESICLHDNCDDLSPGGGWDKMLDQYFRPQIENAVRLEAGKYDREHLYRDPATLTRMQDDIGSSLKDRINHALGGEFFCGPDSTPDNCTNLQFVLKNPTPPQEVADAYSHSAAASQGVVTAQNQAQAQVKAAEGERDAANTRAAAQQLTPEQIAYLQAQAMLACAQNPQCTLVVTPNGANVNVNTGGKQ